MLGVSAPEALLISLLALLVFGPARLAEAARGAGSLLGKARKDLNEAVAELASEE